jgi:riboflavin kinase/FMN adenylyltransferase
MDIVQLDSLEPRGWDSPAVSAGNFDGVHRGHQALVELAVRDARATGGTAVVLTFDPHPSRVLSPDRAPEPLMSLAQKAEVLTGLGVDKLAVLKFTLELSQRSPEEFADQVLRQALGARVVVVGANFRFGRGRAGDVARLTALGAELGFRVHGLKPVSHEGEPISSTRIREALARGAVAAARDMLGRRVFVDGNVVEGAGRGRTLGFPTANLAGIEQALPGGGVYACFCRLPPGRAADVWPAVVNVGRRPTFGGGATQVEAHLLDRTADLYGRRLRVEFVERLREERTFSGAEALVAQIRRDADQARRLLGEAVPNAV